MSQISNIAGTRFGRLIAIEPTEIRKHKAVVWCCKCDCGNTTLVRRDALIGGNTISCGCAVKVKAPRKYANRGDAAVNNLYTRYEVSATMRGYTFDLTIEQFKLIIQQPCMYCGSCDNTIQVSARGKFKIAKLRANGIDRINSTIGYTIDNVAACCTKCNYAKRDMSRQEYIEHCRKVVQYNG